MANSLPQENYKNKWWIDVLFILFILVLCTVGTYRPLKDGDFPIHIDLAKELNDLGYIDTPHTLYQRLILVVKAFIPSGLINQITNRTSEQNYNIYLKLSALFVTLMSYLATGLLLQRRFLRMFLPNQKYRQTLSWLTALICMNVAPILLFTLGDRLLVGYIKPNVWHNPTFNLLKPFALWIFFFVIDHWKLKISGKQWVLLSLMTGLSILSKPNFILSFLPAVFLLLLLRIRSLRGIPWRLLLAMIIPAFLLLGYQYLVKYSGSSESQIAFMPFKGVFAYAGNAHKLVIFYLLSILFPIIYSIFADKKIKEEFEFQLVWINFGTAVLTPVLFVEQPYMGSFNFMWGQNIASFLLFVNTIGWLIYDSSWIGQRNWKTSTIIVTLILHAISFIVYSTIVIFTLGPIV